jgi:lysozyme
MRAIPAAAVEFVARWEGCRLAAYQDLAGVWTIGYGSTGPHVSRGLKISIAQARELLADDLRVAAVRLETRIGKAVDDLSDDQYAALLSFVFNLGADPGWTIWKVVRAGRFEEVPVQLARFVNAGGRPVQGLVNRRAAEVALWRADVTDEPAPPSRMTREGPTPPTPLDSKPLATSKSFMATAAASVTAAGVAVGEVSRAVSPYAGQSELVGRAVSALAVVAALLAVTALFFVWLKRATA